MKIYVVAELNLAFWKCQNWRKAFNKIREIRARRAGKI